LSNNQLQSLPESFGTLTVGGNLYLSFSDALSEDVKKNLHHKADQQQEKFKACRLQLDKVCDSLKALKDQKLDVNEADEAGKTLLHYAAFLGDSEACRNLLKRGATANKTDNMGLTPLHDVADGSASKDLMDVLKFKIWNQHYGYGNFLDVVTMLADPLVDKDRNLPNAKDKALRTSLDIAKSSYVPEVKQWANTFGCYIYRYKLTEDDPVYKSATCCVYQAIDRCDTIQAESKVALKVVKNSSHMEDEVVARFGNNLDTRYVLPVLRVHVPKGRRDKWIREFSDVLLKAGKIADEFVAEEPSEDGEFVVVLPWAQRSLDQVMGSERLAATEVMQIVDIVRCIAKAIGHLHESRICHGDLKKKNVMRQKREGTKGTYNWLLIDLDASVVTGEQAGLKFSEVSRRNTLCGQAGLLYIPHPCSQHWNSIGQIDMKYHNECDICVCTLPC
jgi:hypothetical protein